MRVYFQSFWQHEQIRKALQSDGWELEASVSDTFLGEHPEAADEEAARFRLWRLGLLIGRSLRIEFRLSAARPSTSPLSP